MKKFTAPPIGICIHHSLTPDGRAVDAEAFTRYHVDVLGWDACGYHVVVERVNGVMTLVKGRSTMYQGAHCPDLNATHIGVCLAGNFDIAPPDKDQLDFLLAVVLDIMHDFGISRKNLEYHCDHSQKSCPGNLFPKDGFRLAVAGETRP